MFKPLHDKVLVKPVPETEQKVGSIILPGSAHERNVKGEVVAIGEGRYELGHHVEMSVEVGDIVLYDQNNAQSITDDGVEFFILRETAILGIFK